MKTGTYEKDGENISFTFNSSPSCANKVLFVDSVVNSLVGETYNYVAKDLIFDYMFIGVFTDVDTEYISKCEDPIETIELIEELVNNTNIVSIVKSNIEFGVVSELEEAVEKGLEYLTGIHFNPITEALASIINTIEYKIGDFNLAPDDAMEIAQAFLGIGGEFTAEKMLDAYSKTDIFKRQYEKLVATEEK